MKQIPFIISCVLLAGCASQSVYRGADGKWAYNTQETLHASNSSAQMVGVGTVTVREYDRKTGGLTSDYTINSTGADSIVTVRSKPSGTEAVKLWGLLNLGSDLISGANNVAQDAIEAE